MFHDTGEILIHYTLEGPPGAPVVLMLHSLGTSTHVWDPQAASLAREYRVLRVDLRGHGLTSVTPGPYSVETMARDVLAVASVLGIGRMHVAGLSIGGRIAMELAVMAPSVVASLILCDTALAFPPAELWQQRADAVRAGGIEAIEDAVMARWVIDPRLPSSRGLRRMLERTPPEGYAGASEALRDAMASDAAQIRCPTLVLVGDQDQSTPIRAAEAIRDAIADSSMAIVPGAAHIPTFEFEGSVSDALWQWLTRKA